MSILNIVLIVFLTYPRTQFYNVGSFATSSEVCLGLASDEL